MTTTILILKVVATSFATVQARWCYKGFLAEHTDISRNSAMSAELIILAIILTAIWVGL